VKPSAELLADSFQPVSTSELERSEAVAPALSHSLLSKLGKPQAVRTRRLVEIQTESLRANQLTYKEILHLQLNFQQPTSLYYFLPSPIQLPNSSINTIPPLVPHDLKFQPVYYILELRLKLVYVVSSSFIYLNYETVLMKVVGMGGDFLKWIRIEWFSLRVLIINFD